ncbi:MAG: hypothetical protein AAF515_10965 [Pseudomonadota bacterium]
MDLPAPVEAPTDQPVAAATASEAAPFLALVNAQDALQQALAQIQRLTHGDQKQRAPKKGRTTPLKDLPDDARISPQDQGDLANRAPRTIWGYVKNKIIPPPDADGCWSLKQARLNVQLIVEHFERKREAA